MTCKIRFLSIKNTFLQFFTTDNHSSHQTHQLFSLAFLSHSTCNERIQHSKIHLYQWRPHLERCYLSSEESCLQEFFGQRHFLLLPTIAFGVSKIKANHSGGWCLKLASLHSSITLQKEGWGTCKPAGSLGQSHVLS